MAAMTRPFVCGESADCSIEPRECEANAISYANWLLQAEARGDDCTRAPKTKKPKPTKSPRTKRPKPTKAPKPSTTTTTRDPSAPYDPSFGAT